MAPSTSAAWLLTRFLPAFCDGGLVPVGRPVGKEVTAELFELIRLGEAPSEISVARRLRAARVAPLDLPGDLLAEDASLIAAIHNLLAVSSRAKDGLGGRVGGFEKARRYTSELVFALRAPVGPAEALAAHGLVGPLMDARRRDSVVSFWAGRASYRGRRPPSRALRLPALRRVRLEHVEAPALAPERDQFTGDVLEELLRVSPLTNLLSIERSGPPFSLKGLAGCMTDAWLCRGVTRLWAHGPAPALIGGRLARALMEHLREPRSKAEVSLWLHVFYHLNLLVLQRDMLRGLPLSRAGDARCTAHDLDERWHLALFKVLHRGGETFGLPTGAELGGDLAEGLAAFDAAAKAVDTSPEERTIVAALTSFFRILGFPGRPRRRSIG